MTVFQYTITLCKKQRGFHLITDELHKQLPNPFPINQGILQLFIQHTSASLTINENASPDVLEDMESHFHHLAPENQSYYTHTIEGSDDMPAHIKSSLLGHHVSIPITDGQFNLGIWQGVYLGEHRNNGGKRTIIATFIGN